MILLAMMVLMLVASVDALPLSNKELVTFEINPNPMEEYCDIFIELQSPAYMFLHVETLEGEVVSEIYSGYADKEMHFTWDRYSSSGEYLPKGIYMAVLGWDQRYTSVKKTLILK